MSDGELPEGWIESKLGECVEILDNLRVPVNSDERQNRKGDIPYYGATGQVGWIDDYLFNEQLVLVGEDGAPFLDKSKPIAYLIEGKSWVNNHAHVLRAIGGLTSNQFVKHILDAFDFHDYVNGTTRLKLTQGAMCEMLVLLPPYAEQQRIVAKVEALLARVNAARERLAKLPAILKRFRQSVLAAACSGRLTADWREEHPVEPAGVGLSRSAQTVDTKAIRHLVRRGTAGLPEVETPNVPDTWTIRSVRQLVETGAILDFQDGNHGSLYPRETDFGEVGIKFLTAQQVFDNRVLLDETPLLKQDKAKLLRIGFAKPRDVLLTHNATVGRVALLPSYKGEIILGTSVTYYRSNPDVLLPEFLCYEMQGQFWQDQLESVMEQTTRNQVSVTKQVEFRLAIPPLAEQNEIVRRVEGLFQLADGIEKRVAAATARAEKLTQAILAKAFRGELVPTEAELARREGRDYEPASVLLDRIRAERAVHPPKKPFRVAKKG